MRNVLMKVLITGFSLLLLIMVSKVDAYAAIIKEPKESILEERVYIEDEYLSTGISTYSTANVWNQKYTNQGNIKKSLSMTAVLTSYNNKPYTTIRITNIGKNKIIANAYKGSVGGSRTIKAISIAKGKTGTIMISRADVIKYGVMNGQGTQISLNYMVSLYGSNGGSISCSVKAIKYQ